MNIPIRIRSGKCSALSANRTSALSATAVPFAPSRMPKNTFDLRRGVATLENNIVSPDIAALKEKGLDDGSKYLLVGFDYSYCRMKPPIYFFRIDDLLDVEELKAGMQAVVNECPILASRLNIDAFPFTFGKMTAGVPFNVKTVEIDLDQDALLPGCSSRMVDWEAVGLDELLMPKEEIKYEDAPMMAVGVVLLPKQNVTYIAVLRQHTVGDGNACCHIFQRWSYLTAQLSGKQKYLNAKNIEQGKVPLRHSRMIYSPEMASALPANSVDFDTLNSDKIQKYFGEKSSIAELQQELRSMKFGGITEEKKDLTWLELRISNSSIAGFKDSLVESLRFMDQSNIWGNDTKWLSTFESIAGMMLASKLKAHFSSQDGKMKMPPRTSFTFNTRKKYKEESEVANTELGTAAYKLIGDYFTDDFLELASSNQLSSTEMIALCAWYFHHTLRTGFDKHDEMIKEIELVQNLPNFTGMLADGDLKEIKFVNIPNLTQFSKADQMISLNSWVSFDWLDVNFGSHKKQRLSGMTRKRPGFSNFWFQYRPSNEEIGGIMSFSSEYERDLVKREMSKLVCLNKVVSLL